MYVGTEDLVPSMSMVNYSVLVVKDMKDCFVKKVSSMVGALGLKFRCCYDWNIVPSFQIDKCSPNNVNVCKNDGKCVVKNDGKIACNCSILYEGSQCETSKLLLIHLEISFW